ncbi:MAG: Glutathione hydrolase proenzyme [Chroococcopsis gigantea SAG 12.99]|jgi:gamma-glutamyltranspeptidase/glutathione hydrolase|nr:gamma-glutamyltransferase [Chlorogloea purpurea SAG 13.99]MDV2999443.1 Glutathione hydrolase proenzyme [Chroococcopsis gigantea SAG 12.99]
MKVSFPILILTASVLCFSASVDKVNGESGRNGMVVTPQAQASRVGLDILKAGGNAIDAAVAVGYALAVTEPCCGNIGGGGFMTVRFANGKSVFINFREKAPIAAHPRMYQDTAGNVIEGASEDGYLAVGVPGTVRGLEYALRQYGTLSRPEVMGPAIDLAVRGFILQPGDVEMLKRSRRKLTGDNVARIFLKDGGRDYEAGDRLIQKDLAKTLSLISTGGEKIFYEGEIAQKVVSASQKNGGVLSLKDFGEYNISVTEPLECSYRNYRILTSPPPGGGTTVCLMLNIVGGYDLKKLGFRNTQSLHKILSSMLLAYVARNYYLGDPDFVKIPLDKLLSPDYADRLRGQILPDQALDPEKLYQPIVTEGNNTTHYSVIDREGNAVSVTYTINSNFGAGVIAEDTGFVLNNEMDDFTSKIGAPNQFGLVQGKANQIEPRKRPLSSMSPTIVLKDNQVFLITGSPGGSTIPTTVFSVISNVIDYGMTIDESVNRARFHYQGLPDTILIEPDAIDSKVRQGLEGKGYKFRDFPRWGAAESILVDPNTRVFYGANDGRKTAGRAMGF